MSKGIERGFRETVDCPDAERVEIKVYQRKKAFVQQKIDTMSWVSNGVPMRIIVEEAKGE
jgi:hypothetical protein